MRSVLVLCSIVVLFLAVCCLYIKLLQLSMLRDRSALCCVCGCLRHCVEAFARAAEFGCSSCCTGISCLDARHLTTLISHQMRCLQNPKVTADRAFNGHGTNFENSPEPIYGNLFLPRKFKVAVTVPGDNSVDLFTNDVGVVVLTSPSGELEGFDLLVGGGMGRTHRNENTFARLADALGYVPKEDIFHAMKAIVAVQRDYGRRDDRKQSRLKYLVNEWGIDKFRSVVEQYYGKRIQPFR